MQKFLKTILYILILFVFGCHNASHIRTQKILLEDETAISIGFITNLGGDTTHINFIQLGNQIILAVVQRYPI